MKKVSRMLSLFLSLVMAITCTSIGTTAFAADQSKCANISFSGVENNSYIDNALNCINNARSASGLNQLTLDQTLTEQAKQRAKDIFVSYDSNDLSLPNGDTVASYFPTFLTTSMYLYNGYITDYALANSLSSISTHSYNQMAQSVGVGFFTLNGITTMYVVFSYAPATAVYQNFYDAQVVATVNTLASNIQLRYDDELDTRYSTYICNTKAYFTHGCSSSYVPISNDQVTYKSSKPSVAKYKNGRVYPKKNGNYSMTVYLNSNPAVSNTLSYTFSGLKKPKVTIKSIKSPKKKKLYVKWKNNIKNAEGYEVQYSTSKKFTKKTTKTVTVKGKKKISKTISKLKSKKKYYVRVRPYVSQGQGERFYGNWSKTKSVKVK